MDAWLVWIGAAGVLGLAEMLTMDLVLVPFASAAALVGLLAVIGAGFSVSAAAFLLVTIVLLVTVRRLVLGSSRVPLGVRTGTAALVGSRAVVVERIAFPHPGAVRINGEVWTARAYGEDEVIEPGTFVDVIEIQGATALITE